MLKKNKKQTKNKNIFNLTVQYLEKYSSTVNSWHTGAGIEWTGKKSYWQEEGDEVGDGRAEGLSAIGDGGQGAISHMPDVDGTHVHIWKFTTWRFVCRGLTVWWNDYHNEFS